MCAQRSKLIVKQADATQMPKHKAGTPAPERLPHPNRYLIDTFGTLLESSCDADLRAYAGAHAKEAVAGATNHRLHTVAAAT